MKKYRVNVNGTEYEITLEEVTGAEAAVAPKAAVISCSKNNSYGHPHAELIARLEKTGCDIFCTADCGAVMVETDGVRWKIYGYVSGES